MTCAAELSDLCARSPTRDRPGSCTRLDRCSPRDSAVGVLRPTRARRAPDVRLVALREIAASSAIASITSVVTTIARSARARAISKQTVTNAASRTPAVKPVRDAFVQTVVRIRSARARARASRANGASIHGGRKYQRRSPRSSGSRDASTCVDTPLREQHSDQLRPTCRKIGHRSANPLAFSVNGHVTASASVREPSPCARSRRASRWRWPAGSRCSSARSRSGSRRSRSSCCTAPRACSPRASSPATSTRARRCSPSISRAPPIASPIRPTHRPRSASRCSTRRDERCREHARRIALAEARRTAGCELADTTHRCREPRPRRRAAPEPERRSHGGIA